MYILLYSFINDIFQIFTMVYEKVRNIINNSYILEIFNEYYFGNTTTDIPLHSYPVVCSRKFKIGLLTNEIPPIIYGGVATWIVNFLKMFSNDEHFDIIPIFVAYNDVLPEECYQKYKNIRVINNKEDINDVFKDIDICINNLWIAEDTIHHIKDIFPETNIITVCHSLIRMENITNMGSCYTNNFNQQEITFQNSDHVVLISKAEKEYYNLLGYNQFNTNTSVIYNSYTPQYDNITPNINYDSNTIGYIGRHVPRKRPELPILAIDLLKKKDINVINMGVDYDKYDNHYWRKLEKIYKDYLTIIPFSSSKDIKEEYWNNIGINCITGIYEPFGYTICESIDRYVPVVVSNIDGPKEIIDEVKEYIYTYEVDIDNYKNDINNISKALIKMWNTSPEERKNNCIKARKCLDKLRPNVIKEDWKKLLFDIL